MAIVETVPDQQYDYDYEDYTRNNVQRNFNDDFDDIFRSVPKPVITLYVCIFCRSNQPLLGQSPRRQKDRQQINKNQQ